MQHNHTIQSIRQAGHKVRVNHFRKVSGYKELMPIREIREKQIQDLIISKGGKTVLEFTSKSGDNLTSEVTCHSKEHFNHRIALSVAVGRLANQFNF